jgi:uncharacterized protein (TIGR02145 family)
MLTQMPISWACGCPFTDLRDGQSYNTVQIGTQCWMAQNLNYGTYEVVPIGCEGCQPSGYKYCQNFFGVNDGTCPMGGLYEWANMMNGSASCDGTGAGQPGCFPNVQGLCPNGWHVPSHYEWILLAQTVCAQSPAGSNCTTDFPYDETTQGYLGTTEGAKLKSTSTSWAQYNGMYCCDRACDDATTTSGTCNSSGFTALPGGDAFGGVFEDVGIIGDWWSSTQHDVNEHAWNMELRWESSTFGVFGGNYAEQEGFSVRCVMD